MNENNTAVSAKYSNEELCLSIGRIARDNYANKAKPFKIRRRTLVEMLNDKHQNLNLPDDLKVNFLVKLCYEMSADNIKEAIVQTIIENIGNDSVYNPKRVYPSNHVYSFAAEESKLLHAKCDVVTSSSKLVDSNDSKNKIEQALVSSLGLQYKKAFLGVGNADNAKKYANEILAGYQSMISEYDKIKNINFDLINDFEILRNELKFQREDIVQLLIDLLGDRAKQQHPELFDFKSIEWIDFQDAWKKLDLKYESITNTHKEFLDAADAAIFEFGDKLSAESGMAFKNLNSISKGRDLNQKDIVNAGVQIAFAAGASAVKGAIKSRNKSKEVVAIINRDVELLKKEMQDDNDLIVADIFRLGKLYSKLSDSLLPNYNSFILANNRRIESDFKPIYDNIVSNPIITKAKNHNNSLIKRRRFLDQQLIDLNRNYQYTINQEAAINQALEVNKSEYDIAISLKPKKPFFLINLLTLGRSEKIFDATFSDWKYACKPTVDDYEYLYVRLEEESHTRNIIQQEIENYKKEIVNITKSVSDNSDIIKAEFEKTEGSKEEVVKLFTVVKKIINASREVLDLKLEDELINKAMI